MFRLWRDRRENGIVPPNGRPVAGRPKEGRSSPTARYQRFQPWVREQMRPFGAPLNDPERILDERLARVEIAQSSTGGWATCCEEARASG